MNDHRDRRPGVTEDGFDRIGPLHPAFVWAAVVVVDIAILLFLMSALTVIGDRVEDLLWPGGTEWVTL